MSNAQSASSLSKGGDSKSKLGLGKGKKASFDNSTKQDEGYRKMLKDHATLTPDIEVFDSRFELNPYIEKYKTQTRYRKQGMLVNMGAQMNILKQ